MQKRSPVVVVLLSIVTFGIYDIYWLVTTKNVLNRKTRYHTPTIWLLIVPWILVVVGYVILFASAYSTGSSTTNASSGVTTSSDTTVTASDSTDSSSTAGSGEQLNAKGQTRPSQYVHLCQTAAGSQYVTQGSPNCLGNDSFQSDYSPGVPGTLYSSPCKTTSGQLRYVYVAENEQCPSGTSLVFYNNLCPTGAVSSAQCTTPGTTDTGTKITGNGSTYTGTSPTGMSTGNLGLWLAGMAIIFIGYIAGLVTSIIWFFQFSKAVNAYTQGKMSTAVTFLVLWLIHLIGVALIQDAFNDVEDAAAMGYGAGIGVGQPMAPAGVAPVAGFGAGNGAFSQAAPMTPPAGQPQMGPLAGPSPMMPPAGGVPQAQAPMGPAAMTSPVPVASAPPATPAPAAPAPPAVPSNNPTPAAAPALPHPAHDTGNTRNSNNEPHAEEHSAHQPEIRRFHNGHLGASHGSEDHDSDKRNHDDDSSHHPTLP